MTSNDLLKTCFRAFFLFVPIILWQLIEVFFLPIDQFTFRAWEALLTTKVQSLPGPFYPNQNLNKFTAGDQNSKQPTKWVDFVTDSYGYRNRPLKVEPVRYDAVLIGDSNFAGSNIDQKDIISEVLARKCNCAVYNHAQGLPQNIITFFNDPRFKKSPPKNLVFEMRRGDVGTQVLQDIPTCKYSKNELANTYGGRACYQFNWVERLISDLPLDWQVKLDRFYKQPFYHFLKSKLKIARPPVIDVAKNVPTEELIQYAFEKIKAYDKEAKRRGIKFIFLFFPYDNHEFDGLIGKLESVGITTIGFLPNEKRKWDQNEYKAWLFNDDSHWRESSVVETAELILQKLSL